MVKPKSPMRVVMKAFLPASDRGLLQEPEADEQVAAEAHAFPADEHQDDVGGEDQSEHEKDEQIQIGEEAVVAVFVRHVAGGINVNQQADEGDDASMTMVSWSTCSAKSTLNWPAVIHVK